MLFFCFFKSAGLSLNMAIFFAKYYLLTLYFLVEMFSLSLSNLINFYDYCFSDFQFILLSSVSENVFSKHVMGTAGLILIKLSF
jgi:hypothetical protein